MKEEKIRKVGDTDSSVSEVVVAKNHNRKSEHPRAAAKFKRTFGMKPFPLTAHKLENLVCRIDPYGPIQLGAFYRACLHQECALLLPRPVMCFDEYWHSVLMHWINNPHFFRCSAIGDILKIYHYMEKENVGSQNT